MYARTAAAGASVVSQRTSTMTLTAPESLALTLAASKSSSWPTSAWERRESGSAREGVSRRARAQAQAKQAAGPYQERHDLVALHPACPTERNGRLAFRRAVERASGTGAAGRRAGRASGTEIVKENGNAAREGERKRRAGRRAETRSGERARCASQESWRSVRDVRGALVCAV